MKLWSAQSISQLGTQISGIALPLVALYALHASAFQVAALGTVEFLPFLLFTLPAGVWVDRLRRRWIMVVADFGRALSLGSIPVAAATGHLTLTQLYVAGFVTGTLTVFFDVSYQSYLPSIVERSQLVDGNAKLEITRSGAQILGPGVGGLLVHAITAPYAMLADAISYLWSASFLFAIRKTEDVPERDVDSPSMVRELIDGIKYLVRHRYWRPISMSTATFNFFSNVAFAILVVYMVRRLHMSALAIGLTFSLSSAGGLAAAFFAQKIGTRLGIGRAIVWGSAVGAVPMVLIPIAPTSFPIPFIVVAFAFGEFGIVVYNVSAISLTQALVPERLLGRVNASRRFIVWGTIPLGSLVSGALATWIGLRPTLFVGTIGILLATLPVALSTVRHVKDLPTEPEAMPVTEEALLPTQVATLSSEGPGA
ncbi:MAG: MFS transporter [Actinobacteria bacterium]|nr:MAG: MFS transporter [Actinomycetota bacterium]